MRRTSCFQFFLPVLVLAAASCGKQDDPLYGQLDNIELEQVSGALFADKNLYWPGSPPIIPVCWDAGTPDVTARGWVRSAIRGQWTRYGRVNFVGWDFCTSPTQAGVHIRDFESAVARGEVPPNAPQGNANAYDKTPGARSGRFLNAVYGGVTIPFCTGVSGAAARRVCVQETALHEFGHVLGFYHEEEHPNYTGVPGVDGGPCGDQRPNPAPTTPQKYGDFETATSVMSYCAMAASNLTRLGASDIAGLQRAYGRRIHGQMVTTLGSCLTAESFNPGNPGARPIQRDCDEFQDDQQWNWNTIARAFKIDTFGTGNGIQACLYGGTNVEIRDCDSSNSQTWHLQDVELRGWGGKCLDLINGDTTNGTPVQIFDCFSNRGEYNPNQRWNIGRVSSSNSKIEIRLTANTSKCVTVSGSGAAVNGTPLVISTCTGATTQRFSASAGLTYTSGTTTKCLDAQGVNDSQYLAGQGGPYDGAPINLFTCSSTTLNQQWNVSGQIRKVLGDNNTCLDHPLTIDNGLFPSQSGCFAPNNTTSSQVWDYYL